MSIIGKSIRRVDAASKVTGQALYPGDIDRPNQAYMQVLFAERPHAIVRSIDTSEAEATPGVIAVFTAKDVPVNVYGLGHPDQPVLCGPGSDVPYADRVRFVGDQVALVVADSEAIARKAAKKIQVDYEDLPVVTDPEEAMREDAVLLHPNLGSNILKSYQIRKGDVEQGFEEADVIVAAEYQTPAQEHAYLQPEAGIGYMDEEGRVTVVIAGQWTHKDQQQIAHALDLPLEKVRVIYPAIGGAFGGREDMSLQIVLALAAWRLHQRGIDRPVKSIWSREESIIGHHKRHPYIIRTKWGARKDGKIVAAEAELIQDGGAYEYTSLKVMGNAALMVTGPYEIPNVHVDAHSVYTNHVPGGAFRGFGAPQGAFAAEGQMNKLAIALGMDPVEIRERNVLTDDALLSTQTPPPKGVSLKEVIAACAENSGWRKGAQGWQAPSRHALGEPAESHVRRGIGFACGFKNVGFSFGYQENCSATIEIRGKSEIEEVILYHAAAEVGQGTHTAITQMTAEAAGVPVDLVRLVPSDTASSPDAGSVSASRMTFMAGHSIRGAAEAALKKWKAEERPAIGSYTYLAPKTTPLDPETGVSTPNFAYGYMAEAAVVDVDTETGHVHVVNVICADDVGKAINLQQVVGQIEGAVIQALGYVLMEDFQQAGGQVGTRQLSTYLIPTALDVPDEVRSLVLEHPEERGPWGARGMAEMPFVPLAPAVIAAVRNATGMWFDAFPLTPERVYFGLHPSDGG